MHKIQSFSYHTHTNFSDGRNSLEEMVHHAKQIGFTEMGISDHLIVHKNMKQDISWPLLKEVNAPHVYNDDFKSILEKFKRHCDEIRRVSKQENFKLYVGFEVDYFPYDGWEDELKWFLAQLDYDYLHTGNHFFCEEGFEHIINMTFFKQVCPDKLLYKEYAERHFEAIRRAVESGMFKFLAHMDYIRRVGPEMCDVDSFPAEKQRVLDALEKTNTALEISTKGLRKIGDFYPSASVLQAAAKRNIAFVISDDAHKPEELRADFDKAEAALKKYGITRRLKF